ncbi:MAG: UDP-N-acetylmuramate:L-alanyl-gamma-D-glutamyl-meso-diaminopimelate ligase [Desulfobacterales bacterium]|nr:UDP-N-acetylmuramate:L-alanyl-gamma-D-glutamyl-meso-diaminopimelate ligase [Desulfobacterales bacterium]
MANQIPENVKTVHLIAVCGTAMGALACMLKELGLKVTGSDQNVYPPMSTFLAGKGIHIFSGFDPSNISYKPDLVVVGNAVRKDNPEVLEVNQQGLNYCSMPQALNRFVVRDRKALVVAGTHGKTTTSSILAWILQTAGLDPSFMIGGILQNFNGNYRLGEGDYVVLEGDEYDTAFFDKGAKFFHFDPYIAILTSIEFDHADIFEDLAHVKKTFGRFVSGISRDHTLISYDADRNIDELTASINGHCLRYGTQKKSHWQITSTRIDPPWNCFEATRHQEKYGTFKTRMVGSHNLLNALAAVAAADRLGVSRQAVSEALETYAGVKRRQEIRGVARGVTVIDDFAHHPTAVRETIAAVRPFYPEGRLIAVFEPRTNTSMRNVFQDIYPSSFDDADVICIRKPPLLEKIPLDSRFSSEKLVENLVNRGKQALYFSDTGSIIDYVSSQAGGGDVVLIMSNGGFDNIHERLLTALGQRK